MRNFAVKIENDMNSMNLLNGIIIIIRLRQTVGSGKTCM